jgi:hypothetical protein
MVAIERELTEPPAPPAAISADAIPLRLRRIGGTPRQVFAMTVVGAILLALFASRDLAGWSERLGDGTAALVVQKIVARWDERMASLGLVRPHEMLRDSLRRLLEWQWDAPP